MKLLKFDKLNQMINEHNMYKNKLDVDNFFYACKNISTSNLNTIKEYLQMGGDVNIQKTDNFIMDNWTALMLSIFYNNIEAIKLLVKNKKIDLEIENDSSETALLIAIKKNNYQAFNLLIEAGAEIERRNKFGRDALIYAAMYNCVEIAEVLVGKDMNMYHEDNYRKSAIHYAKEKKNEKMIQVLENPNQYRLKDKLIPTMNKTQKNSNIF